MTDAKTPPSRTPDATDAGDLERFLRAYQPTGLSEPDWASIRDDATILVLRAGAPTRLRVEKDIQLLGAMTQHCLGRGRRVSLDLLLSDEVLLDFDTSLRVSDKTRENKRGIARRLQAVHRDLPWRAQRRGDGERVRALPGPEEVHRVAALEDAARLGAATEAGAEAFVTAVQSAREARGRGSKSRTLNDQTWTQARRFAAEHGWAMTWTRLNRAMTHEVLAQAKPAAVLVATAGLTRADLDLALTAASGLAATPSEEHRQTLRGRTPSSQ